MNVSMIWKEMGIVLLMCVSGYRINILHHFFKSPIFLFFVVYKLI